MRTLRLSRLGLPVAAILAAAALAQGPSRSSPEDLLSAYKRADDIAAAQQAAYKLQLDANWIGRGNRFWYSNRLAGGKTEYWRVDSARALREPAFDHARLAAALAKAAGKPVDPDRLPISNLEFSEDLSYASFDFEQKRWRLDLGAYEVKPTGEARPSQRGPGLGQGRGRGGPSGQARPIVSPDEKWTAELVEGRLRVKGRADERVAFESKTDTLQFVNWAPDSKRLVAFRCIPGDRKQVHLVRSSPAEGGRATLQSRNYDLPGDKLDTFETFVIDFESGSEIKSDLEPIVLGGHPFIGPPNLRWWKGGRSFLIDFAVRGYAQYRVEEVELASARRNTLIDERSETFVDTTNLILRLLSESEELIWRSERDGWGRLYLIDGKAGTVKNAITPAGWVVRGVYSIDEKARRLCFTANCTREGEDPYFIHGFTVGFDGKGLVRLTEGSGYHRLQFSPDEKYFVDTYSRVDDPPVHELRRMSDGKKLLDLERADLSDWKKFHLPMPEPFVAKGRDGVTDIWGVVYRPSNFDPNMKYPVIENLYAGPQDSFAPKAFSAVAGMQRLAELGFIVVQCDGMGTRNRGKSFHDVCWKNLGDAGFPDRILWMKALAAKYPYVDLTRVGVYGTSAGGQSSTGALLFHPEFYKVAVSSCGCHDNRMDKYWWNEQWMGYPVGPHYAQQSNITNAKNLQGRLLLMVGELDTNVPPESTLRLVDALIKAEKEFDFLILPGQGHGSGGAFGERKRRDFFVRWLLGLEPPDWNRVSAGASPLG